MAKKKYNGLNSKSFFNIVVLSVSALGLILAVFAVQGKTNTRSNANVQGNTPCDRLPTIELTGTENYPNYVIYKLRLNNNDKSDGQYCKEQPSRDFKLTRKVPKGWDANFININNNIVNRLVNIAPNGSKRFEFKVKPSSDADKDTYNLSVTATQELPPFYSDVIYLKYTKD